MIWTTKKPKRKHLKEKAKTPERKEERVQDFQKKKKMMMMKMMTMMVIRSSAKNMAATSKTDYFIQIRKMMTIGNASNLKRTKKSIDKRGSERSTTLIVMDGETNKKLATLELLIQKNTKEKSLL